MRQTKSRFNFFSVHSVWIYFMFPDFEFSLSKRRNKYKFMLTLKYFKKRDLYLLGNGKCWKTLLNKYDTGSFV